jgi:tetratricopeptide (TPR) repeat protein
MRRLFSASVVVLVFATCVCAQRDRDTYNPGNQTFEVTGQVNVAGENIPVRDIQVRLERFSGGVVDQMTTDARGRFRFANLQRGYYKVIISAAGFAPAQQDADLTLLFRAYMLFNLVKTDRTATSSAPSLDVIDARVPAAAQEEYLRGRDSLAKKSQNDAITHFRKALLIYPEFFDAHLLMGMAFMDLRDWPNAEAAFNRALEIKPDNATALFASGEVYWREKRHKEAESSLLAGLQLDEKNWHGYFTLGRLYWDNGETTKAAGAIGHTLQLKPDFAEAHLLAGNILLKLGEPQRARVEYEEYLRLAPKGDYAGEARELVKKLRDR